MECCLCICPINAVITLSALEVWSRQGAIQIHMFTLTIPYPVAIEKWLCTAHPRYFSAGIIFCNFITAWAWYMHHMLSSMKPISTTSFCCQIPRGSLTISSPTNNVIAMTIYNAFVQQTRRRCSFWKSYGPTA